MAKSKTPAKRARRAEANRLRNKANKSRLRTALKNYEESLQGGNLQEVQENLKKATSLIDRNVAKGVLHKNTAARKKSALAKRSGNIGE